MARTQTNNLNSEEREICSSMVVNSQFELGFPLHISRNFCPVTFGDEKKGIA